SSTPANAQTGTYPERPIRFILSAPAGGSLDALGRVIGEKLGTAWQQPVVVESRAGAAGMLAATAVAKAPPDGYTVLLSLASVVQNTVLRRATPYRLQDLTPVSLVATMPVVLAVRGDNPAKSLDGLVRMAREPQHRVSLASWGNGSTGHIISEAIGQKSGANFIHVAYKGEAEPLPDLLGGRVTAATGSPGFYLSQLKDVRILAVAAPARLSKIPDVPTFEEAGYPLANLSGWGGFFVPAGTPAPITARLSAEIQRIVALPEVAQRIRSMEYEPVGSSSEAFARFIEKDAAQWAAVVKKGNIVLD
ncbi:tripartite tricarboxylate transporter substrate binding protein, partial [Delftia tsuruhatensis]